MIYLGIDDTDSKNGMCTTYLATRIIERLDYDLIGYPKLVRLNPMIPWKTRGNAAICLRFGKGTGRSFLVGNVNGKRIYAYKTSKRFDLDLKLVLDISLEIIKKYSDLQDPDTNPGLIVTENKISEHVYWNAVRKVVSIEEVQNLIENEHYQKLKNGRGIIGAAAAIAWKGKKKTYELITYLPEKNWKEDRFVSKESVIEFDRLVPSSFENIDYLNDHISVMPHSKTPILYGVRGTEPDELLKALNIIKGDRFESFLIFETNQASDDHLVSKKIKDIESYENVKVAGMVTSRPRIITGGHVIFKIKDSTGTVYAAAYEPTKQFRDIIKKLEPGDKVKVCGGVKDINTINIEKIEILKLAKTFHITAPLCPVCGKRMESAGKGQRYRCKKCKTTAESKIKEETQRALNLGFYEVPGVARRHLATPLKLL